MVTAESVRELREKTGAGMMDCKKALTECQGDMEQAIDWLRKKGLSQAAKKSGRTAAEGLVGVKAAATGGAMVEVNAETDFVGRNEHFQNFVRTVTDIALTQKTSDVEALKAAAYPETGRTVAEELTHLIAVIGENMNVRRCASLTVGQGIVGSYVHNAVVPGMGRIGVLVALESTASPAALEPMAKHLALHIAAAFPQALSRDDLSAEIVAREKAIVEEQAKASGRPDDVIAKMVEGRMRKFYEESVLLEQVSVVDGTKTIQTLIDELAKEAAAPVKVAGFKRFQLGEGIEKEEKDFAAEVAAQLKA